MAAGICSIALLRQTVPVFYAIEKIWTPVVMTMVSIAMFIASALPLMDLFGHVGIAIALSIAPTVQAAGLVLVLRRRIGSLGFGRTAMSWLRMLPASAFTAASAYGVCTMGSWEDGGNSARNLGTLLLAVVTGMVVYVVSAYLLKSPELSEISSALRRRIRRKG
jgi:putative peptidoglycan lipid II flippase